MTVGEETDAIGDEGGAAVTEATRDGGGAMTEAMD